MIRLVEKKDQKAIHRLLYQVHDVHAQLRPDLFKIGSVKFTEDELSQRIADQENPIFVYTDEKDQVLGYVFCDIKETKDHKSLADQKVLFIDDLCVDGNARGQKIGEQLYQYVLDYAKSIDCDSVTLHVWNENAGALRFYERLGMTAQYTHMEQKLN